MGIDWLRAMNASSAVAKQMRPSWTEGEAGKPKHTLLRNTEPALRLTAGRSTIARCIGCICLR